MELCVFTWLESGSDAESDGISDAASDSEGGCITDAFAHWSLYWHHLEALEIADKFSSGQIDDAELLSQRFGLEEKLEALQRVDYGIFAYAGAYYGKKVGSWHCDCDRGRDGDGEARVVCATRRMDVMVDSRVKAVCGEVSRLKTKVQD